MPANTPREIHRIFEAAFNAADPDAIVALYEPAAVLVAAGKPVTGHAAIREAFRGFLAQGARMNLVTREVIETTEGLAILHGAWSLGPPASRDGMSKQKLSAANRTAPGCLSSITRRRRVRTRRVRIELRSNGHALSYGIVRMLAARISILALDARGLRY